MTNWACLERVNRKEAGFRKSCHIRSERRNWEWGEEKLLGGSDNHPLERLSVLWKSDEVYSIWLQKADQRVGI